MELPKLVRMKNSEKTKKPRKPKAHGNTEKQKRLNRSSKMTVWAKSNPQQRRHVPSLKDYSPRGLLWAFRGLAFWAVPF